MQLPGFGLDLQEEDVDVELNPKPRPHLTNNVVQSLSWRHISVSIKDRSSKQHFPILSSANGHVEAGQILAILGPSGSAKTTLLNVLAHRTSYMNADIVGDVMINGKAANLKTVRRISSYVEQEDALIGSLTVRETVDFAAKLATPKYAPPHLCPL